MAAGTALLSAGGTGGHLFPAQALAQELDTRGWDVHLATDERARRFADAFPAQTIEIVPSATFGGKNPIALWRTGSRLALGYWKARRLIKRLRPDVAVGFGGYPTVPPLLAASHMDIPTVLHEQNAVMGRANRFLAGRVDALATGFDLRDGTTAGTKHIVTGNPLRAIAHDAAKNPYSPPEAGGPFNLLVFGGSQGARFFSQIIKETLPLLEEGDRARLRLTLQARPEDREATIATLAELGIEAEVEPFFDDLPHRIARAHAVICRAGASSVSELSLIGRPSLLIPFPGALDDDQGANAAMLEAAGGAVLIRQKDMSAERLASLLSDWLADPAALAIRAQSAKKTGVPDAAQRLADLVEAQL